MSDTTASHTPLPWIAKGPDEFGDFHLVSEGEELAKCVVVQNGFRTPAETAEISKHVVTAVNAYHSTQKRVEELEAQAYEARGQIEQLDLDNHALRRALYDIIGLDHHNHGPESSAAVVARAALRQSRGLG